MTTIEQLQHERDEALARVRELEALFQQTQSVHVSWVEEANKRRGRIAELEAENARLDKEAFLDLAKKKVAEQMSFHNGVWHGRAYEQGHRDELRIAENERLRVAFDEWSNADWESCVRHGPDERCDICDGARIDMRLRAAMEGKDI